MKVMDGSGAIVALATVPKVTPQNVKPGAGLQLGPAPFLTQLI